MLQKLRGNAVLPCTSVHAPFALHVARCGYPSPAAPTRGAARPSRRDILASQEGDAPTSPPTPSSGSSSSAIAAEQAPASSSSGSEGASSSTPGVSGAVVLGKLQAAEPIDRLRYQAQLLFDALDTDYDGQLSAAQLSSWFVSCNRKLLWCPGLAEVLAGVAQAYTSSPAAAACGGGATRESFVRLMRAQVQAVSCSGSYQTSALRPDEAARLQAVMGLTLQEVCAAKWVFTLLDLDNDGKVELSLLSRAQGIEAYMYEDKLEDADADEDGLINFEEFLGSYARVKPVGKNIMIMLLNTAAIYFILQATWLDVMLKVLLVGVLVVRPQIISKPAVLLYDIVKQILDRGKAEAELAKANRGVWRPA